MAGESWDEPVVYVMYWFSALVSPAFLPLCHDPGNWLQHLNLAMLRRKLDLTT